MSERVKLRSVPDMVGRTLGQFRLAARLGEGGMGVVYRAVDQHLRRTVALKIVSEESMRDEGRRRRFFREARSAAAVTHPNVATVYEIDEADGYVYIAMELVDGFPLRDLLRQGRLPLSESVRIMRAVARALAKAHEKGIVHRDLKPENVMLNEDREVKVLDFGLAKLLEPEGESPAGEDETASLETGNRLVGTPAYMSPEQATGKAVDARSDVWSFGVMLYELLTGQRPFRGTTSMETLVAISRDDPPPATSFVPMPAPLELVIETCLKKKASDRYPSGKELLMAIESIESARALVSDVGSQPTVDLASLPSMDGATKESHRSGLTGSLRKRTARGAAILAAGVAVVVGATWIGARGTRTGARTSEATSAVAPPAPKSPAETLAQSLADDAVKKEREGRHDLACGEYERASDLDEGFGRAALEAAGCHMDKPQLGRAYFRRAWAARATLDELYTGLLDAYEALFQRDPQDARECASRLSKLAAKWPDNARIHAELGRVLDDGVGDSKGARVEWGRALRIDPDNPRTLEFDADTRAYDGDFAGARQDVERCLDVAHGALGCIEEGAWIDGESGQCAAVEAAGRRMLAIEPTYAEGASFVASALLAQGSPVSAVREILRRRRDLLPADERATAERADELRLALVGGDLATGAQLAREAYDAVRDSSVAGDHGRAARDLAAIEEESGAPLVASKVADEYLAGRDAWEPSSRLDDWALADEPTPLLLAVRSHAGLLARAQFERDRSRAVEHWEARTVVYRSFIWVEGYAVPTESPSEATIALAQLPAYEPLPPYTPLSLVSADIGRTYLLAGRVDDAIPWLEKATRNCFPLEHPIEHTRAQYFLGQAREAKGDKTGACAAYSVVRDRWGKATPRSVTAQKALARMGALRCAE